MQVQPNHDKKWLTVQKIRSFLRIPLQVWKILNLQGVKFRFQKLKSQKHLKMLKGLSWFVYKSVDGGAAAAYSLLTLNIIIMLNITKNHLGSLFCFLTNIFPPFYLFIFPLKITIFLYGYFWAVSTAFYIALISTKLCLNLP